MARPFRIDFGCTMTEIAAGARLHYSPVGKIVKAWENQREFARCDSGNSCISLGDVDQSYSMLAALDDYFKNRATKIGGGITPSRRGTER